MQDNLMQGENGRAGGTRVFMADEHVGKGASVVRAEGAGLSAASDEAAGRGLQTMPPCAAGLAVELYIGRTNHAGARRCGCGELHCVDMLGQRPWRRLHGSSIGDMLGSYMCSVC